MNTTSCQDALHVGNEVGGDEQSGVRVEVGENGVDDVVSGGGIHAADGLVQQIQPCAAAHDQDQLTFSRVPLDICLMRWVGLISRAVSICSAASRSKSG